MTWFDDDPIYNHGLNLRKPETFDDLFDDYRRQRHRNSETKQLTKDNGQIRKNRSQTVFRWYHLSCCHLEQNAPGRMSLNTITPWLVLKLSQNLENERLPFVDIYLPRWSACVPSINTIITTAYGIDRKSSISGLDNENFRSVLLSRYPHEFDWRVFTTTLGCSKNWKPTFALHRYPHQWKHVVAVSSPEYCTKRIERNILICWSHQAKSQLFVRSIARHLWPGSKTEILSCWWATNACEIMPPFVDSLYGTPAKVMGQIWK